MFDYFSLILRKYRFFWNILFNIFSPILPPKFMQKMTKNLKADFEKKMLLMNGITDNTEFIGSFPSGVQFKMIMANYFISYTFL